MQRVPDDIEVSDPVPGDDREAAPGSVPALSPEMGAGWDMFEPWNQEDEKAKEDALLDHDMPFSSKMWIKLRLSQASWQGPLSHRQ